MTLAHNLLLVAERYSQATGLSLATVSTKTAGSGHFLRRLRDGETSCSIARYEQILARFRSRWPEGADWPAAVPYPCEMTSAE